MLTPPPWSLAICFSGTRMERNPAGNGIFGGQSPQYWANRRSRVRSNIYPDGPLTTLPDSSEVNPFAPLPAGCSQIVRYVTDAPGGRTGGTALQADLAIPSVAPVGKCLVFMCGHSLGTWVDSYCLTDGSSVILRMLACGWYVLCLDLPGLGFQPTPQVVVINGSTVTPNPTDNYTSAYADGGPSPNRIFFDHIIRAMNQITATYGITKFALAGHSGGACTAAMLACIESRFSVVHLMSGGWYVYTVPTQIESDNLNPAFAAAAPGTTPALNLIYMVGAALPGRITVVHSCPTDDQYNHSGDQGLQEYNWWANWVPMVQHYFGNWASVTLFTKMGFDGSYHAPDPVQAAWIEAHLLANM